MIATVFPESSVPRFVSLFQQPDLISASACLRLLNSDKIIPSACSATACLFPSDAL